MSSSLEFGRYLDTVGFASFTSEGYFQHEFLDANVKTLKKALDLDPNMTHADFKTPDGKALSDLILETQTSMGLLDVLGCSPKSYYLLEPLDHPDSLWGLYMEEIVTNSLFNEDSSKILIQSAGDFRYDLLQGDVTVTDLISVSPFNNNIYLVAKGVKGFNVNTLLLSLNALEGYAVLNPTQIPDYLHSSVDGLKKLKLYDVYTTKYHLDKVKEHLERITGKTYDPVLYDPQITPGDLWRSYVAEKWSCVGSEPYEEDDYPIIKVSIVVFLLILCWVFIFLFKNKVGSGYKVVNGKRKHLKDAKMVPSLKPQTFV